MLKPSILDPAASYSFSQYAALPFDIADILAEFGVAFQSASLQLPEQQPLDPTPLIHELTENLALVDPTSEIARRESLIFPVLKTVCKFIQSPLKIEYSIQVSNQLKGNVDYFIPAPQNFVIIEAKNADLGKGFTQLAVELIALDRWIQTPVDCFYGAVTTGDTWKFGLFHRQQKLIQKDINTYGVPNDLAKVLAILFGITLQTPSTNCITEENIVKVEE
ncbi:hypothetical protein [Spirulina sp. 06S082]|uniref:hypothetical protein n=1 Tax=Spirulina sp. 06S082 TaxID=3110248 RepID=UPI002B2024FC|nr:hypothetical protein [Spirulina sp. 06S082]MEA5467260.1 hypothetical protein [Spirulina sp. 06S082]